jgi:hypothetical protein
MLMNCPKLYYITRIISLKYELRRDNMAGKKIEWGGESREYRKFSCNIEEY